MNYEIKRDKNIQKQAEAERQFQKMGISLQIIGSPKEFLLIRSVEFTNTLIQAFGDINYPVR